MKLFRPLFLLLAVFLCDTAWAQPHYWTWSGAPSNRDWDTYFQQLTDVGIRGLILQTSPEKMAQVIPVAEKYGVTVYAWMWIMNNRALAAQHPEWLDYNRNGESLRDHPAYVDYYKFLTPALPEVRAAIAAEVEAMAGVEGLRGISMDYCRYVDQILPTSLWSKYGIVQDREYAEWDYGYHPAMRAAFQARYGYDPVERGKPEQNKRWLQFRLNQVTEVANQLGDIAHSHGMKISASPFPTPEMSRRMVRQDWGHWNLDLAFPMIYQGFYYGDAAWVGDCVRECVQAKPETEIYCGLHVPDYRDGANTLTQAMTAALAAGAKGIALYTFDQLSADQRAELKAFITQHP